MYTMVRTEGDQDEEVSKQDQVARESQYDSWPRTEVEDANSYQVLHS